MDENKDVQSATVEALGKIGPAAGAAIPALKEIISDNNRCLRQAVANHWEKIDQQYHPIFRSCLPK